MADVEAWSGPGLCEVPWRPGDVSVCPGRSLPIGTMLTPKTAIVPTRDLGEDLIHRYGLRIGRTSGGLCKRQGALCVDVPSGTDRCD